MALGESMDRATVRIWPGLPKATINPNIYGHFAEHLGRCIYGGIWSGESNAKDGAFRDDVVDALARLEIPVLRWPGGCFGDQYHWRDGVGPRAERPTGVNLWWRQVESNAFGTNECIDLCRRLDCEPYLSVNVGSGTPREAREWLEYCNFSGATTLTDLRGAHGYAEPHGVRYWGVGNETWGCGGMFSAEQFASEYARFANYLRPLDPTIQLVAAGGSNQWSDNKVLTEWNQRFCEAMPHTHLIDHVSIHHYFNRGNDTNFSDSEHQALFGDLAVLERAIQQADRVLGYYYPDKFVGLVVDEWGTWHPQAVIENGLEHTNTLRDGVFAGAVLNLLCRYAHRVTMANLAQTINVLQCVIHTYGAKMVLSPVYHAFRMMNAHKGASLLTDRIDCPAFECRPKGLGSKVQRPILDVCSSFRDGSITVSVVNQSAGRNLPLEIVVSGARVISVAATQLRASDPRCANTVDDPEAVTPQALDTRLEDGRVVQDIPPHSLTVFHLESAHA